jgi:transposase
MADEPNCGPGRKKRNGLSPQQMKEIVRLHELSFGTRKIAKKVGVGRKVVRNLLLELDYLKPPDQAAMLQTADRANKLDPFRETIKEKVARNLTNARILREIKEQGYEGGLTILSDYTRTLRVKPRPKKKVWRRFETDPGEDYELADAMCSTKDDHANPSNAPYFLFRGESEFRT